MKIVVLPGTMWQVPLMKKIKSLGHELHLVNPTKTIGVVELADHYFESDIFAYEDIIEYCRNNQIDAVISDECDIATDIVAKYNLALGANCISEGMADLFTNKNSMRDFCKEHNINPIPHKLCTTLEDAHVFFAQNGPKVIMKPINSNASHGVFTITSEKEIMEKLPESLKYSRNVNAVLLEKYIDGTEFTVDGIMTEKGHITLAISEKTHYKHNENIANSLFFTHSNPNYDYDLLRKTNNELLDATKLPFGLTHVEYKYMDGKFYLIEMAARGGGNLISAIIAPFMGGVDNYEYLINRTIDSNFIFDGIVDSSSDKTAILKFLDLPCEGGIVKSIKGEDYLIEEPNIKSYKLNFKEGDYIHQPESDSVRIGFYIICANTRTEFDRITQNIEEKLVIEVEES